MEGKLEKAPSVKEGSLATIAHLKMIVVYFLKSH